MFRARIRTETSSRPTATRGSVGSAQVWDERRRALRAAGHDEIPPEPLAPAQPEAALALAPAELSALIAGIVAVTLDTRLADCEPARRALLARELESRLGRLFQASPPMAPAAPEPPMAAPASAPAELEEPTAARPVETAPTVVTHASPAARALGLVLEDRLSSLGGTLSARADLRQRLIGLALASLDEPNAPEDPGASSDELRGLDVLQRRAFKLERSLAEARAALAYVSGLERVDEGLASIYRTVQGLGSLDPRRTQKRAALEGIFNANLALQKPPSV